MEFALSEEQSMLKAMLQRFLAGHYDAERRRAYRAMPLGFDPANQARLAELGAYASMLPEHAGGLGGTAADAMIVMETLGHGLSVEPYLMPAMLAAPLLADHAPDAAELTMRLASGDAIVGVAHLDRTGQPATRIDADGRIHGSKTLVLDAASAEAFIVTITDRCVLVDAGAPGLLHRPYRIADGSIALELGFDGVEVSAQLDAAPVQFDDALLRVAVAASAEMVGVMDRLLAETIDYAKTRQQFGQPIGRFQAVQHGLARAYIALEQSRSMVFKAALTPESLGAEWRRRARACYRFVSGAALDVAHASVQYHGGIGITDELAIGHGHKRIVVLRQMFGTAGELPVPTPVAEAA